MALGIVAAVLVGTIAFSLIAVRHLGSDPQQYILGGRSFGTVLLWVLMGGELYTTFSFLGIAGWAYGHGGETFYILSFGVVGFIVGYLYLPRLWRFANERGLLTLADFFAARYRSPAFGAVVACFSGCVEVLAGLVYLTGLQILLSVAGFGAIDATQALVIAFVLMTAFVFAAGLRGMAWASIVKDSLVLGAALIVGVVLPVVLFGSPAAVLERVIAARPHDFTVGGWTAPQGKLWFMSTLVLSGIAFFSSASLFAATYAAKSEETVRRNTILLPLYVVVIVPMLFAGYMAWLVVPGLHGSEGDAAYLRVLQVRFPAALVGVVCAAGVLCGLIPFAARLLAAASQFTKNVLGDVFGVAREGARLTWATRSFIVVVAAGALCLWLFVRASLVDLLLFVYNGAAQFMPGVLLGLFWKRASLAGIATGLVAGEVAAFVLTVHPPAMWGLNPGFVALLLNAALAVGISSAVRPPVTEAQ